MQAESLRASLVTQVMIDEYDALFIDTRGSGGKERRLPSLKKKSTNIVKVERKRAVMRRNGSNSLPDIQRRETQYEKPSPTTSPTIDFEVTQSLENITKTAHQLEIPRHPNRASLSGALSVIPRKTRPRPKMRKWHSDFVPNEQWEYCLPIYQTLTSDSRSNSYLSIESRSDRGSFHSS